MYALVPCVSYDGKFKIKARTAKAVYIEITEDRYYWIPLQYLRFLKTDSMLLLIMPRWIAYYNGFNYFVKSGEEINNAVINGYAEYITIDHSIHCR